MQGMQDEIGGFVIGIAAAVTEEQFRLVETADRETQAVAHRLSVELAGEYLMMLISLPSAIPLSQLPRGCCSGMSCLESLEYPVLPSLFEPRRFVRAM